MKTVVVLIYGSTPLGLSDAELEALAAGRRLASLLGGVLVAGVIGGDVKAVAKEAAIRGVDRVIAGEALHLASYCGDGYVEAAEQIARAADASLVVVSRGPEMTEIAPRLAVRLEGDVILGVAELVAQPDSSVDAIVPSFGGSLHSVYRLGSGMTVLTVGARFMPPPERDLERAAEIERLELSLVHTERIEVLELPVDSDARLEDARVVVAGGRGLGEAARYGAVKALASVLGGLPAASRAIVDLGWAPVTDQVGLTGKIVTPDVYIAFGISGASQHMVGCSRAEVIVAINTDPHAPIFRHADYGIIADANEALDEILRQSTRA